jgi:hypothetical protein
MDEKWRTENIVGIYSPHVKRKQGPLFGMLYRNLGPGQPNKGKTIVGRTMDSYRELQGSLHFLAGVLTLLPLIDSARRVQFQHDGEKLLLEASEFARKCEPSVGSIRKMRVFSEKINGLTEKVKRDLARHKT